MARSVGYKRVISDAANWHQEQALNATIYILRQTGPTGFLLKEEDEEKNFKVYLGDPHSCSCSVFRKEKDVCKHICWLFLKKFRVHRTNPITWQLGLVERELNEILRGDKILREQQTTAAARRIARQTAREDKDEKTDEDHNTTNGITQKPIDKDDVCPICQEELLDKRLPVTYCRNGCGNSVHIKCMKVWAEHQRSTSKNRQDAEIQCPFCRSDFGPFHQLTTELTNNNQESNTQTNNLKCNQCNISPIQGKCYRCGTCADFHLCQTCFNGDSHRHHPFLFRQKRHQRWKPANRTQPVTNIVMNNIANREITENDYDLLLQLDQQNELIGSNLDEEIIEKLHQQKIGGNSWLLKPGKQCRTCLRPYNVGDFVRRLPCSHIFHRTCIDTWLLHRQSNCPQCGATFTNQGLKSYINERRTSCSSTKNVSSASNHNANYGSNGNTINGISTNNNSSISQQHEINLAMTSIGLNLSRNRSSNCSSTTSSAINSSNYHNRQQQQSNNNNYNNYNNLQTKRPHRLPPVSSPVLPIVQQQQQKQQIQSATVTQQKDRLSDQLDREKEMEGMFFESNGFQTKSSTAPNSASLLASSFVQRQQQQKQASNGKKIAKRKNPPNGGDSKNAENRWGSMRNIDGNEFFLSGNAI